MAALLQLRDFTRGIDGENRVTGRPHDRRVLRLYAVERRIGDSECRRCRRAPKQCGFNFGEGRTERATDADDTNSLATGGQLLDHDCLVRSRPRAFLRQEFDQPGLQLTGIGTRPRIVTTTVPPVAG